MRALIGKVILLPPSSVTSRIDFCHEKKKKTGWKTVVLFYFNNW